MAERKSHERRVRSLLAQDRDINQTQLKELRMQLELALETTEAKAKETQRRILIALLTFWGILATYAFCLSSSGSATLDTRADFWRFVVAIPLVIGIPAVVIIGVILALLYLFKYGPQVGRTRFDLQTSMMLELQQQIAQLRESIERRD